jgi:hypothetical protein
MVDTKPKSLDMQVGGGHYKDLLIQPAEYVYVNKLGYHEGAVVYYVTRWKEKNYLEDLEKAKHHIQILIDLEKKHKLHGGG